MTLRLSEPAGKTAEVTTTRHWTTETLWNLQCVSPTPSCMDMGDREAFSPTLSQVPDIAVNSYFFGVGMRRVGSLKSAAHWRFFFCSFCFKPPVWKLLSRESLLYSWSWVTSGHFLKIGVFSGTELHHYNLWIYCLFFMSWALSSCQVFLRWSLTSPLCKGTVFIFTDKRSYSLNSSSRKQLSMHLLYSKWNCF